MGRQRGDARGVSGNCDVAASPVRQCRVGYEACQSGDAGGGALIMPSVNERLKRSVSAMWRLVGALLVSVTGCSTTWQVKVVPDRLWVEQYDVYRGGVAYLDPRGDEAFEGKNAGYHPDEDTVYFLTRWRKGEKLFAPAITFSDKDVRAYRGTSVVVEHEGRTFKAYDLDESASRRGRPEPPSSSR